MIIAIICMLIVSIAIFGYSFYQLKHTHEINTEVDKYNQKLKNETAFFKKEFDKYFTEYSKLEDKINNAKKVLDSQQDISKKAFENYCNILEKDYEDKEKEYNQNIQLLNDSYSKQQEKILSKIEEEEDKLNKIRSLRTSASDAIRREKEIEQKLSFYCLQAKDDDLKDIAILETIKPKLNNPRILSMLIWQTFWRKAMTDLCNNVIGVTAKCGIYKITNVKTKECYIGQAADLATRWKDHAKAGLGIDTPAANKLYKAMQEYGIWNFSWEVIEECKREELNEKEKYYIELYQSKEYGYNSIHGNSK